MSHVDDGRLNALLDGELDSAQAAEVASHIAGCAECAKRLEEAKRFLAEAADLLGALELPKPAVGVGAQARRVSRTAREAAIDLDAATQQSPAIGSDVPERLPRRPPRPQPERRAFDYTSLAWAATIVLAVGVGFLADEVRHTRDGGAPVARGAPEPQSAPASAAPSVPALPTTASGSGAQGAGPVVTAGRPPAAGGKRHAPPAAKAPPGEGTPVVPGRSATGIGHKRLEPSARNLAIARTAAEPAGVADAVPASRAAANAPAPPPAVSAAAREQPSPAAKAVGGLPAAADQRSQADQLATGAPGAFRHATLEQAVARLQGTIRLIDGMQSERVEIGPGRLVPGADSGREVVRVVYGEPGGAVVLDQQRIAGPVDALAAGRRDALQEVAGAASGEVLTTAPDGQRRLRWVASGGFWLSLAGRLPADSLRALAARVR